LVGNGWLYENTAVFGGGTYPPAPSFTAGYEASGYHGHGHGSFLYSLLPAGHCIFFLNVNR